MSILMQWAAMVGWRGGLGALLGALLSAVPAYYSGRHVEGAATQSRIEAALANARLSRMEVEHEQILEAGRARTASGLERDGHGRMPNDGFLRD